MVRLQVLNQARQVQTLPSAFFIRKSNFFKLLTVQWCMDWLFSLILLFSVCVTLEGLELLLNMKGKRVSSRSSHSSTWPSLEGWRLLVDGGAWSGEVPTWNQVTGWHFKGSPWNPVIDGVACCIRSQPRPDQGDLIELATSSLEGCLCWL